MLSYNLSYLVRTYTSVAHDLSLKGFFVMKSETRHVKQYDFNKPLVRHVGNLLISLIVNLQQRIEDSNFWKGSKKPLLFHI